jgi:hypothetical protein
MSAVDVPPGIGLRGSHAQRFVAPRRARRLAKSAVVVCIGCGAATWLMVARRHGGPHQSAFAVLPLAFSSVAVLGFLIRSASISVARDGMRWGWQSIAFVRRRETIVSVTAYNDGIALAGKRGAPWFLASTDWERFGDLISYMKRAQFPVTLQPNKAPWRAKMQGYGRALDLLMIGSSLASLLVTLASLTVG